MKEDNDNNKNDIIESNNDKKALLDQLEERIRAAKIDSNLAEDDDMEYSMDDDDLDDLHDYKGFKIDMDADDYHNESCMLARCSHVSKAAECAIAGLKKFPLNPTLMADVIKYSTKAGDIERSARYYSMLKENVELCRWDWRDFTYCIWNCFYKRSFKTKIKF